MAFWFAIAGSVAGAAALSVYFLLSWLERRRPTDIEQFALKRGWRYQSTPSSGFFPRLGAFRLFSAGIESSRALANLIEWEFSGALLRLFDYSFAQKSGEKPSRQTVLHLEDKRLELPAFSLQPEGPMERYLQVFGGPDINFEHHAAFSQKYVLRGDEPAAIHRLFRAELLDFFARHPGLWVEGRGSQLLFYRKDVRVWPWKLDEIWGVEGLGLLGLLLPATAATSAANIEPDRLGKAHRAS